jgi:hypothetical protein
MMKADRSGSRKASLVMSPYPLALYSPGVIILVPSLFYLLSASCGLLGRSDDRLIPRRPLPAAGRISEIEQCSIVQQKGAHQGVPLV